MKNENQKTDEGANIIPVLVGVAVAVLLGWGGYSVITTWLNNKTSQVQAKILSAVLDDDVAVPGQTVGVSRIVVEMEITFPYGSAPDTINELGVRDDNEAVVDVNWGPGEPEKNDIEAKSMTKLILRQAFFPTDFKQGKLVGKNGYLCYFKMPPVTTPSK